MAQGQGEKGPCDPTLFLSAPLALLICVAGSSGLYVSLYLCPALCLSLHTAPSVSSCFSVSPSLFQFLPTQLRGRTALSGHPKPTPGIYTVLSVSSGARLSSASPPV